MKKLRRISSVIIVFIALCAPAISSAHGGFEKGVDDFRIFVNQDPISPLVGESVTTYIQVMTQEIKPIPDLPVTITLIDTAFDDEPNDEVVYVKHYRTNINGSLNFDYTYDKENYFDIEVSFKDPQTGRDEQTGYLVLPRDDKPGYIGQAPTGPRSYVTPEATTANMNIYFDLFVSAIAMLLGVLLFGKFEQAGSTRRRIVRAAILVGGTGVLSYFFGHWSLLLPLGASSAGAVFHFWWCWKNGIHPLTAEPYDRYLQLRGWSKK